MESSRNDVSTQGQTTPGLILGPFYPVRQPTDANARLWRGERVPSGAQGLRFTGRVVTRQGSGVPDAVVELWHADPHGRYPHPSAPECGLVSPLFLGYGRVNTASDGRFEFHSLAPGAYGSGEQRRAGHLHVQITGRQDRLLTQVFLPGSGEHANDHWYRVSRRSEMLVAAVISHRSGRLHLGWNAVLANG